MSVVCTPMNTLASIQDTMRSHFSLNCYTPAKDPPKRAVLTYGGAENWPTAPAEQLASRLKQHECSTPERNEKCFNERPQRSSNKLRYDTSRRQQDFSNAARLHTIAPADCYFEPHRADTIEVLHSNLRPATASYYPFTSRARNRQMDNERAVERNDMGTAGGYATTAKGRERKQGGYELTRRRVYRML